MKKGLLPAVFGAAAGVCLLLRVFQMLALTEHQTGFMKRENSAAYIAVSVIMALFILAAPVFALFCKPTAKKENAVNLPFTAATLLLGGACVFDVLSFTASNSTAPGFLKIIYVVFGALCAVYFAAAGVRSAFYFPFSSKLAAIPPAFFTVRAATVFVANAQHAVISDTVFDVFIYCCAMLLFLEIARAVNGAGSENSTKKITFFGLALSLSAICASLPKIALALFHSSALHDGMTGSVLTLFLGVYAALLVFSRVVFSSPKKDNLSIYYAGKH